MAGSNELRQQILDASVGLIEAKGVGGLSMREVARQAGVSHQAPYHYFADREAILAAIAGEGFRRLRGALESARTPGAPGPAIAGARSGARSRSKKTSAVARLEAGGRAYVEFARASPGYFRVMFRPELVDLAQHPEAQAEARRAFAALEALVADLVTDGTVDANAAPALVLTAWSVAHGLASLILDGPLATGDPATAPAADPVALVMGTLTRLLTGR